MPEARKTKPRSQPKPSSVPANPTSSAPTPARSMAAPILDRADRRCACLHILPLCIVVAMPPTRHTVDEILPARPARRLRVFRRAVERALPGRVDDVLLFGSRARGARLAQGDSASCRTEGPGCRPGADGGHSLRLLRDVPCRTGGCCSVRPARRRASMMGGHGVWTVGAGWRRDAPPLRPVAERDEGRPYSGGLRRGFRSTGRRSAAGDSDCQRLHCRVRGRVRLRPGEGAGRLTASSRRQ